MANSPISDVGIFDDFEDAKKMSSTVCQQVPMEEYEEDISNETDKALGDLCLYLDQHPEVYARILRKRKQEDLENSGLVSFVKSKMMKLVHGEDYPECLVSLSECMQQTSSLKAGMCKTFQYCQEIKGIPIRHSKRLAAKQNAHVKQQMETSDCKSSSSTSCVNASYDSQTEHSNSRRNSMMSSKADDTETTSTVKRCTGPSSCLSSLNAVTSVTQREMEGSHHEQNTPNAGPSKEKQTHLKLEVSTSEGHQNDKSKACPSPPTPPPLPPILTITAQQSPWSAPRKTLSSLALNVESRNCLSRRRSPRVGKGGDGGQIAPTSKERSRDGLNLPSKKESPFLTPMVTRKKTHKRSSSNSSVGSVSSVGSMESMKSIQSEILSSNPISRLKLTQIARSPGGTPVRSQIPGQLPSEPLHKALVTAMKTKFKNVYTPSPHSGNTSLNGSDTTSAI